MAAEVRAASRADLGAGPEDTVQALRQQIALLEGALAEARSDRDVGRTSEDRFRSLFEMSRDGIVFVDLEGHIEEMNQAYLDLVGYGRDEITTHTYQDLTPEKWRAGEAEIIETQVMRRGFSDEYEKEYVRKDGSIAPISLRTILVRDLDGRPIRFMGIVRDITELKEQEEALKASEKRYRGLFDLSHDGVVFVGLDGPIEEANPAYLDMLGYELDELIGVTYQQLTPARWDAMEAEIVERQLMSRGYTDEYEKEYIRKEGSIFPVAVRSILVRDETGTFRCASWGSCATSPSRSRQRRRWSATPATSPAPTRSWSSSPMSPPTTCRSRCARSGPSARCSRTRSAKGSTTKASSTSTS